MSDEYQLRKDVDKLLSDVYDLQDGSVNFVRFTFDSPLKNYVSQFDDIGNPADEGTIDAIMNNLNETVISKLGLDKEGIENYNFAMISQEDYAGGDYWILVNADYNYDLKRFIKINDTKTSFGIQLQSGGTYAGEEEIDPNNTGVNVWRCPPFRDSNGDFVVYKDTSVYDYSDVEDKSYIGVSRLSDGAWVEYGIASGWNNAFMLDSYGGMTVGGAGFEIDGNGIFPFTRLTHSIYTDSNDDTYALFGLLDNAYHPTAWGWECDSNSTYSWFVGLRTPVSNNIKDNTNTEFIVMYNDTTYDNNDIHNIDVSDWHIVFRINTNGVV